MVPRADCSRIDQPSPLATPVDATDAEDPAQGRPFLLILGLCGAALGFSTALLIGSVLPGAALSVVLGNLYEAKQAQDMSARTGRTDGTALRYGINTASLFACVFLAASQ